MIIKKAKLDLVKLQAIPSEERALFVLLGHCINEINILNKTFMLCSQYDDEPKWRAQAHSSQALVFARVLVGKLHAGWELVRTLYFNPPISARYDTDLNPGAADALSRLKKYFGRADNVVKKIRNQFSSHYSPDDAKIALESALAEEEIVIYGADTNGNTLYYFSEYVVNTALLKIIDLDATTALDRLMTETSEVVAWLNEFAQGLMAVCVERFLLNDDRQLVVESIDIGSVPRASEISIPYFFEVSLSSGHAPLASAS